MWKVFCLAFYFIYIVIFVHGTGIYTIVAPGTLRPYFNYNVAVTVHDAKGPCEIEIGISAATYNVSKVINILPMSTKNVEFVLPELKKDDYRLFVKGLAGIAIENSTHLVFEYYDPLVYIQIDKPIYKPGDLVQFRVLFLNQKTQPEQLKKLMMIAIKDHNSNIIQRWKNITLTHGVYTGGFQLSKYPQRDWFELEVSDGEKILTTKSFGVIKYDLPNFEVFIDAPRDIAVTDEVIRITVESNYTFGKPVRGKATVSILYYSSKSRETDFNREENIIEKTFPIDGKGFVEFNIWKDFPRPELIFKASHFPFWYDVYASVKDQLTDCVQYSLQHSFALHRRNIVIDALNPPKSYAPGKLISYTVIGKKFDGTPVQDNSHPIKLNINEFIFYSMFNKSGLATFKFVLPDLKHPVVVNCKYFGTNHYLSQMTPIVADVVLPGRFQLNLKTQMPQLKKEIFVEVKWTEPINYFVYLIVGRGNIIKVERVEVLKKSRSYIIKIMPTFDMMPKASIFVQYIINNSLRFEELIIEFDFETNDFDNTLEITTVAETSPGNDIEFQISTDPNSYVAILGIDQSVWLYETQYDLHKSMVFIDLYRYETQTPKIPGSGRYPGKKSGLVSLTNAHFPWSSNQIMWGVRGERGPGSSVPREQFPETWIFDSFNVANQTHFNFVKKIPDTMTSWVISGFSMNSETGFAITKNPTMIKVFKSFFITVNLPNTAKQGEFLSIPVMIYNYLNKTQQIEVTMDNSGKEFEFVEATNENEVRLVKRVKHKRISVPSNSADSVSFMIKPLFIGMLALKVTALTELTGDSVHKKLKVEPQGVTVLKNHAFFINLNNKREQMQTITLDIPANAVPNSEHIEISAIGDIIGHSMKNIENLVHLPCGYGEQNMINFIPSILILKYLKTIDQKMPNVTKTTHNMLKIGYQRELQFRQEDGSYSAYGSSDISGKIYSSDGQSEIIGSTWLTAYVVRSFLQASEFIEIDQQIITKSLEFLISKQTRRGNFAEFGQLLEFPHLNDASLTAFVLLTLLENKQNCSKYEPHIKKGIEFLIRTLNGTDDIYSLSITALVLKKVKHPLAKDILAKIKTLANNENGFTWWSADVEKPKRNKSHAYKSSDIVITSYVLQALLEKEPTEYILPIIRWLTKQRNSNGGFTAAQDTIVGLEALIKFAEKTGFRRSGAINIEYICEGANGPVDKGNITIMPDNIMLLNTHELLKDTRKVTFIVTGNGSSLVQVSYSYNTIDTAPKQSFHLNINVRTNTAPKQLILDICVQFIPNDAKNHTNVFVTEVELPTGFTVGDEKLKEMRDFHNILYTETKKSDTIAIIYLRSLAAYHQKCIAVEATTIHEIAKRKPVPVVVYDYYDKERCATAYYEIQTSLCEICEADDCVKGCRKSKNTLSTTSSASKSIYSANIPTNMKHINFHLAVLTLCFLWF